MMDVTRRYASLADADVLRDFVQNVREGIYLTNEAGEILDANRAFLEMLGYGSIEALRSAGVAALLVDPAQREQEMELIEQTGAIRDFELQLRRSDGAILTALDTSYAVRDPNSGETIYHGILVDITERKALENRLRDLSLRDPLTGARNRRYLAEIERAMVELRVEHWGVIFIDIDFFKKYNDDNGHQAGDLVLIGMSRFLSSQVRAEEVVLRFGGDEFVIVLPGADQHAAETVARRLQEAATHAAPVPFSLGWASRELGETFERTLQRANQRLLAVRVAVREDRRE
jgi:diguanylate cyclase (GGDEF)-like protein/PAS domain S-box-containing protein